MAVMGLCSEGSMVTLSLAVDDKDAVVAVAVAAAAAADGAVDPAPAFLPAAAAAGALDLVGGAAALRDCSEETLGEERTATFGAPAAAGAAVFAAGLLAGAGAGVAVAAAAAAGFVFGAAAAAAGAAAPGAGLDGLRVLTEAEAAAVAGFLAPTAAALTTFLRGAPPAAGFAPTAGFTPTAACKHTHIHTREVDAARCCFLLLRHDGCPRCCCACAHLLRLAHGGEKLAIRNVPARGEEREREVAGAGCESCTNNTTDYVERRSCATTVTVLCSGRVCVRCAVSLADLWRGGEERERDSLQTGASQLASKPSPSTALKGGGGFMDARAQPTTAGRLHDEEQEQHTTTMGGGTSRRSRGAALSINKVHSGRGRGKSPKRSELGAVS